MKAPAPWHVALIDSCGAWPQAERAVGFAPRGSAVIMQSPLADTSGHGTRIAGVLSSAPRPFRLSLAQVFSESGTTSAATLVAALDWSLEQGATLVHLSLGLLADRDELRRAIERAIGSGTLIIAAAPARGSRVFPASYPGVIEATGDARCAPGEISALAAGRFGGCPTCAGDRAGVRGGASIGAAWVSRAVLEEPPAPPAQLLVALEARARYHGRERRVSPAQAPDPPAPPGAPGPADAPCLS